MTSSQKAQVLDYFSFKFLMRIKGYFLVLWHRCSCVIGCCFELCKAEHSCFGGIPGF